MTTHIITVTCTCGEQHRWAHDCVSPLPVLTEQVTR